MNPHDSEHAKLDEKIYRLTCSACDKDARAGRGSCGSPAHPARWAEIDRLEREERALWRKTSPEYQRTFLAAHAARNAADAEAMDNEIELTHEEAERQQDALAAQDGVTQ